MSESRVRSSLTSFLGVPAEDVDDIILDYVVSVVGELVEEEEEAFDADGFMEMLSAYVPQAKVDMAETVEWMGRLAEAERNSRANQEGRFFNLN